MALPSALASLDRAAAQHAREVCVASVAVLLIGLGAISQVTGPLPLATAATVASPASAGIGVGEKIVQAAVGPRPVARHRRVAVRTVAVSTPVERWLPTGTGMWIHDWSRTEGGNGRKVVRRAKLAGLTHLFVQTGSSKKGWIGGKTLSQLMPATNGTDIKVIAWDFPTLQHPEADARRLARAAWWHQPGVPMVAAVAPDIETASEGTHATRDSINRYYRTLRRSLPARVAILATVPWPSENRINRYPYIRTARNADAIIPMAYWYNRSPSRVTRTSMRVLQQYGKPVIPVGQGYDGRLDAPYLAADPHPGKSVTAFVTAARMSGAQSISLWSWQTTGSQQWSALKAASKRYAPAVREVQAADAMKAAGLPVLTKATRPGWHPGKTAFGR
ncbi:MAG: hypothetical protein QOJ79_2897 [Actinomycetota bacterium]|nr:hypothetical protein [Actinomycetota bacterium]